MPKKIPDWFRNAVFYEIYPQSFRDANGDGIGDLAGIIEKLDYVKSLGVDGIWLNPCFDSPFQDAGYDVRDYFRVAARYGTNADLEKLIGEVHRRGMRLLLDLVPGHTSLEHRWFKAAVSRDETPYDDYYVFTDGKVGDLDGLEHGLAILNKLNGEAVGLGVGVGVGEVAGICTGVGDGSVRRSLLFRASESSLLTPKNPTAMMAITRRLAATICHFQKLPWLLLLF